MGVNRKFGGLRIGAIESRGISAVSGLILTEVCLHGFDSTFEFASLN